MLQLCQIVHANTHKKCYVNFTHPLACGQYIYSQHGTCTKGYFFEVVCVAWALACLHTDELHPLWCGATSTACAQVFFATGASN